MYLPERFAMTEPEQLHGVIRAHPFATLVSVDGGGLEADHLPLLLAPEAGDHGVLRGHIARANPLWHGGERAALAIFHGPQAYITPSWYPAKREHGRVVPTWNYQVVHAHGQLRFIDDPAWLERIVAALTQRFEHSRPQPWSLDDAPRDYIEAMCRAIIGVELTVTALNGKRKASQHRPRAERTGICTGLQSDYAFDEKSARCLCGIDEASEPGIKPGQ
ncbi:FMN-binding negative transcriptional regulator [Halomonas sp. HP20-15]|uniref:FMN-binding negative transcriptional regulator n=1 Tax=Halomonas sp. HP20-15 TaxID=3085901 RepID=UPI002980C391|nr:FMN-binding negative transcriptional regulator [Halomonas sp. HP20-15]MDW5376033.1 FMN-binding negative transcriptional regulator [Halomonas sp. HP20-15]